MGEYRRAEGAFREALETLPASPQVWLMLGQVLLLRGDYGPSEKALNKAVVFFEELRSDQVAVAMSELATLQESQRNCPRAGGILQRALLLPGYGQLRGRVLTNLAVLNWKLGQKAEAEVNFTLALREMKIAVGHEHPDVGPILEVWRNIQASSERLVVVLKPTS